MSHKNVATHEKFLFTLEWLLAVTERYAGCLQFGLFHINFENPRILGEAYGAQKASHKLDEALHSLQKAFRKTDLVSRDGVDFWILAPYTPADEKLADKIKHIIEMASESGLQIVERDLSIFSLPNDAAAPGPDSSALEFLAYLKKNHVTLARCELSLPPSNE
jgi:hypothetical protein